VTVRSWFAVARNGIESGGLFRRRFSNSHVFVSVENPVSHTNRHVSNLSNISYAGYLLKRSNRPFAAVSPFPLAFEEGHSTGIITNSTPQLQPNTVFSQFSDHTGSSSVSTPTTDWGIPPHLPQHLQQRDSPALEMEASTTTRSTSQSPVVSKEAVTDSEESSVEDSLLFAAAFFCVSLPAVVPKEFFEAAKDQKSSAFETASNSGSGNTTPTTQTPSRRVPRSSPIKVAPANPSSHSQKSTATTSSNRLQANPSLQTVDSSGSFLYSRQASLPPPSRSISNADDGPPVDFVDPTDGHIWRAKYCVLEDGVLYFYRHEMDAETPQAHAERQQHQQQQTLQQESQLEESTHSQSPVDLAKSPMPRSRLVRGLSGGSANGLRDDEHDDPIWEKRVPLDGVGAVRSAEMEFGRNAFELAAVDDEDCDDKLVLRARNVDEMNEWLFQFHRSIACFVMNIMDHVGSAPRSNLGDLHRPVTSLAHKPMAAFAMSPVKSPNFIAFSPRFQKMITTATPSLSHGHGRNSLHRRRVDGLVRAAASMESPDSPTFPFPMTAHESAPSSRTVTPIMPSLLREMEVSPELSIPQPDHIRRRQELEESPELSAPQSDYPETERPPPSKPAGGMYVPPHLRNQSADATAGGARMCVPLHLRSKTHDKYVPPHLRNQNPNGSSLHPLSEPLPGVSAAMEPKRSVDTRRVTSSPMTIDELDTRTTNEQHDSSEFKRGGCADPAVVVGSVSDNMYVPRKASRLGKVHTDPFGCLGNHETTDNYSSVLRWEIGAVSECGIRESNEDAYLIASNLSAALERDANGEVLSTVWSEYTQHPTGLFAVFDGHCGDQAARFAAERLPQFIRKESMREDYSDSDAAVGSGPNRLQAILHEAIVKLDQEFCDLCVEEGRSWESGATALIAMLADEHLIIGNLGDARGIMGRSITDPTKVHEMEGEGWNALPVDDYTGDQGCLWKEVTDIHSPGKKDERARIEKANGWITTETEIPIGQLQRMVLFDEDVVDILKRCFADRYQPSPKASAPQRILHISRVCGELAVSRSIGDRDFKAAFNPAGPINCEEDSWDCPVLLPYPDDHSRYFVGDLVSNIPDFQAHRVGEDGVSDEFLLLACDGLWDVMDADDAARVTRDLLFQKNWPAKKAAARLAELAIHLGSSDNITVIVVRFFSLRN